MGWSVAGGAECRGDGPPGRWPGGRAECVRDGQVESALQAGRNRSRFSPAIDVADRRAQAARAGCRSDIGGDLPCRSRADNRPGCAGSSYQAGASLTIGLIGPSSLSLNLGGGRERADSTLVNRQTSIIADERLDAYVDGHTQLDGGLIASLLHHPVKWAP